MRASGGVLMEFSSAAAPATALSGMARKDSDAARLRSVDSGSSLGSTVYEDDVDAPTKGAVACSSSSSGNNNAATAIGTTATATASSASSSAAAAAAGDLGGFEASTFFRFADFGGRRASAHDDFLFRDDGDNNEILPPRTVSPTNQTSHDAAAAVDALGGSSAVASASTGVGVASALSGAPPPPLGTRGASLGARPRPIQHAALASRRKNSIEMFLSQSPSQALGGGFLKMALDDHPPPPPHRLPPRRHDAQGPPRGASVVAISQQQQQEQSLELDPRDATDRSGVAKETAAAAAFNGYLLSHSPPAVDTDDEWSSTSSQEMLGNAAGASASAYYYAESQAALHQQHHHQQQQQQQSYGYGSGATAGASSYRYASDAYGSNARVAAPPSAQPVHHQASWNASPVPSVNQSSYGMASPSPYGMHSAVGANPSAGFGHYQQQQQQSAPAPHYAHHHHQQSQPQQQPPQQLYHQQQVGHRAPQQSRSYGRSQSMYASSSAGRMMMMESSPPPSPHTAPGGMYGVKQCKFFLQGHCRMGSKCKFAHHAPQHAAPSASPYQQHPQLHTSQSFHVAHASPATSPHHHHQHQRHGSHEYDSFSSVPSGASSYMPRGSSRQPYRMGGGGELHPSGATMTMAPHPSQHHALGGLPATGLSMAGGGAGQVAPADAMLKFEEVQGRVFAMSKDQNGCRLLQEQLEYYDERKALCDLIYAEAMEHLAEMMVDPFGNYLFQKLLERAKPLQRLEIVRRVGGHLVAAALNLHGTRSVQKVVEVCATSAQVVELDSDGNELRRVNLPDLIVEALKDDAVRLCIDSNGNHVIQRALQFMKPEYNQFVFDAVCKECTTVGTHRHGCCVLQRCLDAANDQQKREVILQVEKQAMKLMQDPYGNYVVQYVLDSCTAEEAYGVIVKPLGNVFELSIQKFSSNVIEKCLEKAPPAVLKQYVEEITICPKMQKMLQDQFANYVVQRALSVAAEDQCMALVKAIRPHLPAMKNTSGGRRITARILKRFPHMDLNLDLGFEPAALGASYAMGGMPMQQSYASHHQHHQPMQPQQPYESYGMPFASTSTTGSLGLNLHGASMMHHSGGRM